MTRSPLVSASADGSTAVPGCVQDSAAPRPTVGLRVGNMSQGYAQVVTDMPLAHDTDLERCRVVMQEVADSMFAEKLWATELLGGLSAAGTGAR